jgi:hypothetical protein
MRYKLRLEDANYKLFIFATNMYTLDLLYTIKCKKNANIALYASHYCTLHAPALSLGVSAASKLS